MNLTDRADILIVTWLKEQLRPCCTETVIRLLITFPSLSTTHKVFGCNVIEAKKVVDASVNMPRTGINKD
jgi:hypothetical protein